LALVLIDIYVEILVRYTSFQNGKQILNNHLLILTISAVLILIKKGSRRMTYTISCG